ncbi:hypothetical protein CFP56_028062 [Quercus suber]|uniref:WAT1-related protein n=1 Tax=Quercus suber TaxID=58331 RepID=A0AAW0JVD4_QUESU
MVVHAIHIYLTAKVGENVLGAVIVIIGLYMLLWGKEGDQEIHNNSQEQPCLTCKENKGNKILLITTADKEVSQCEP